MFDRLAAAVDEVEVPADAVALVEVWGLIDRLTAKATLASAAFDAADLWDLDGDTSMTAWLRHHARMTSRDAAHTRRTGRRLTTSPVTAAAWVSGALTGGHVGAITANVDTDTADLYAEHETDLVPVLAPLTVDDAAAVMRTWAARAEATVEVSEPRALRRSLHLSSLLDGRRELRGDLDPEAGEIIATALRLATTDDLPGEPVRTPSHRRADALVDVCRHFLDHQRTRPGGRHRPP